MDIEKLKINGIHLMQKQQIYTCSPTNKDIAKYEQICIHTFWSWPYPTVVQSITEIHLCHFVSCKWNYKNLLTGSHLQSMTMNVSDKAQTDSADFQNLMKLNQTF